MERILVVDDEPGIRSFLAEALSSEGYRVVQAGDGLEATRLLERATFHLLITDLKMPRLDGMGLLRQALADHPEMQVIVLTAHGSVDTAVEAMKMGAYDYLQKPLVSPDELRLLVARALERARLLQARPALGAPVEPQLVTEDPAMRVVVGQLERVAATDATVLLLGESGTGKELAARRIHAVSPRAERPFVAVNCAALSAQLIESELFGHEKGAFTGAIERRRGRFELADGGSLFLDEVAELKPDMQAKLLRVLQERTFERVGGQRTIEVDIRLVAATNRDLPVEMRAGRFREDLYHRLAVFPLRLPPLRERPADILPLARHLLARIGARLGRPGLSLPDPAGRVLVGYAWPGNVRELANALERAAILATGDALQVGDLALGSSVTGPGAQAHPGTLRELERQAIQRALVATGGHRKKTAELLGIGLRTLYDKLKEYGLD